MDKVVLRIGSGRDTMEIEADPNEQTPNQAINQLMKIVGVCGGMLASFNLKDKEKCFKDFEDSFVSSYEETLKKLDFLIEKEDLKGSKLTQEEVHKLLAEYREKKEHKA